MDLPTHASVVVVGAGLSGLVTALDLVDAGHDDVLVVEARDRVGGRVKAFTRENGSVLQAGAELSGPLQPTVLALAERFGIGVEPIPMLVDPENMGAFVRIHAGGDRLVEPFPLATDAAALEAHAAAAAALDALMADLTAATPWTDARAAELDLQTLGAWLDANVTNPVARAALEFDLGPTGPVYETSLLASLSFVARHGGMAGFATALPLRFTGGAATLTDRIRDAVGDRIALSAPVRAITRTADGVTVDTDRGVVTAEAVVLAFEPALAETITFDPPLPADRAKLQARWIATHGVKIFATYARPFWREDGLNGFARGREFVSLAFDFSPLAGPEGIMAGMVFVPGGRSEEFAAILGDPERTRAAVEEDLVAYFGPGARAIQELHVFDWHGDRWSRGVGGSHLPPGLLSGYGHALKPPVGRIVWAGEHNGTGDFLEGAASAGRAAATTAAALLGR